jgi:predicted nucleic acid-binding Zn ribbon protein
MPTRAYRCEKCKGEWEVDQKVDEPSLRECNAVDVDAAPGDVKCGGELVPLLFATPGKVRGGTPKFYR